MEEATILEEHLDLAYAVPAELFVLEIHGVRGPLLRSINKADRIW
jgi:hypothetical protein